MQATPLRFLLMGLKSGTAPVNRKALVRAAAALSHNMLDAILLLQLSVKYVLVMPGPSRGCSVLGAICTKRASSTGRLMNDETLPGTSSPQQHVQFHLVSGTFGSL